LLCAIFTAYMVGSAYFFVGLDRGEPDADVQIAWTVGLNAAVVALFLTSVLLLLTAQIRQRAYSWPHQPQLHGPHWAQITDDGVVISNPRSHLEYRWEAFVGFRETANLFILYLSPAMAQLLPKRALADPRKMDAMCAMVRDKIKNGHLLPKPGGFPVAQEPLRALPPDTSERV